MDVNSLYTNIDHKEGANAYYKKLETRKNKTVPSNTYLQTLYTTVFSKPTYAYIYLNPKSSHPEHMIRNIPKSQFLRHRKIYSDTSDYIKKSNEYLDVIMGSFLAAC